MEQKSKHYVIKEETRKRCKVFKIDETSFKRFRKLNHEQFPVLKEAGSINFPIYFRAGDEMIEFIRPEEFSPLLIDQIKTTLEKPLGQIDVFVLVADYPKYQNAITSVRQKKYKHVLELDPTLDPKVMEVFEDLSAASQMIVKGGINNLVVTKAKEAVSKLMESQLESAVSIGTLSRMILCDSTLYDHSASVAMLAGIIATQLIKTPLSKEEVELVSQGGLYHDAGKTCVPNDILNKPGKFSPEEYDVMKTHTTLGNEELIKAITKGAPIDRLVAKVALEHHERWDGHGYPFGKKGRLEDDPHGIHLYARIVMIADVYSALIMKRVYKEAYTPQKAIAIMKDLAPTDYDMEIFEPFRNMIDKSIKLYEEKEKQLDKSHLIILGEKDSFANALRKLSHK